MKALPVPGTRLLIAGLGGQGVVFATRLVAQAAIGLGWPVIAAETHGMSQRGGSVLSHIKIGPYPSSLIRRGNAHLVLALDAHEAVRALPFLQPGGACVVNAEAGLPDELSEALLETRIRVRSLPATSMALSQGTAALVNTIVVGCAAGMGWLPIPDAALRARLADLAPGLRRLNLEAFELGFEAAALATREA